MDRGGGSSGARYHYGVIETSKLKEKKIKKNEAPPSRNLFDISAPVEQHQATLDQFELKRAARAVAAPTLDADVRQRLRELGEPICLFGEGPYERRERLRLILAQRSRPGRGSGAAAGASGSGALSLTFAATPQGAGASGAPPEVVVVDAHAIQRLEEANQARLFYTEGSEDLLLARKAIARYSLPRAVRRLRQDRRRYNLQDPFEAEAKVIAHNSKLQKGFKVVASQVGSDRPLTCGRLSPDDTLLATASWTPLVQVWDMPACTRRTTLVGHTERVHSVSWHPTPKSSRCQLASGSSDSSVCLWNLESPSEPVTKLTGHEERVNQVEFHPSGDFVLSTSNDETWRLWDVETGTELLLQEGHSTGVYSLKVHPDGSLVLTGDMGGVVRVWDLRTGKSVLNLQGHVKEVLGISLNDKMPSQVATCSDDNTVRIWDLRRQRSIETLLAHDKLISEVMFEPNEGRFLLTASYDTTLKLWNSVDWSCTRTLLAHDARVMGADVSKDGLSIVSASFDRTFKLWKMGTEGGGS